MRYHVERQTMIDAPVAQVRPLIEDFHRWNSWSPWTVAEPNCPVEIKGSPGQPDHSMSWNGEVIGSGKTTLEIPNDQRLFYHLEFFKPWKSTAKTSFIFEEVGQQTKVTWTMDSNMPFFLFFMVKMMKNWIGMDYDRGLRMLKEVAEKGRVNCETTNKGITDYKGFSYLGIQRTVPFEDMSTVMKKDFEKIVKDVVLDRGKSALHWVCIYPKFDMKKMEATYIAAVSDENLKDENLGGEYIQGSIQDTKALEVKHDGSYDFLGNAWAMGMMFMRAKKHKGAGYPFEQYWNSPLEVPPEELKTSIFFPIKGERT